MSWWQWALIVVSVGMATLVVVMALALRFLVKTVRELTSGLADLRAQTLPLLADTRSALRKAEGANRKADVLLETAASLTGTADAASKLAYNAITNPFVKILAWFTGSRRALARLAKATEPRPGQKKPGR